MTRFKSLLPDSAQHPVAEHPYFSILIAAILVVTILLFFTGLAAPGFGKKYGVKAPFYTGILLFLCILNILTVKTATLPVSRIPILRRQLLLELAIGIPSGR